MYLLGVRKYTSSHLCFLESGLHPVQDVIARRGKKLRVPNNEEPFHIAYELCREADTPGYRFMTQAVGYHLMTFRGELEKNRQQPQNMYPTGQ